MLHEIVRFTLAFIDEFINTDKILLKDLSLHSYFYSIIACKGRAVVRIELGMVSQAKIS